MRTGILLATLMLLSGTAVAQDMKPLAGIAADVAVSYPFSRCAGLYQATMEWTGRTRMSDSTWDAYDAARERLILLSALSGLEESGNTIERQVELTVRDVRNIADLYLSRLESNYARSGHAFVEDDLIRSDFAFCGSLVEATEE